MTHMSQKWGAPTTSHTLLDVSCVTCHSAVCVWVLCLSLVFLWLVAGAKGALVLFATREGVSQFDYTQAISVLFLKLACRWAMITRDG